MQEYYFLFFLAWAWLVFASVQDVKKTEVANWVSYSLIGFAFAYRIFYSVISGMPELFAYGLFGFGIFFALAHIFYYTKTFAGADAKLLMGMGVVLPFENVIDLWVLSLEFLFLLFFLGAIYSIIYSVFIMIKNKRKFAVEFRKEMKHNFWNILMMGVLSGILFYLLIGWTGAFLGAGIFVALLLFIYLKSFETSCLIAERKPDELMEGDWLEEDVRIGRRTIARSVHGLSREDIMFLRKHRRKVIIKQGIPFVPAFLIAFSVMVFFLVFLQPQLNEMISLFLWV